MEKTQFIDNFITTFLATWTANNYDIMCAQGEWSKLENPPAEDAVHLAECAWRNNFSITDNNT